MLLGCFVASVFALSGVVSLFYPDKISVPRTFPGGLEEELGGPRAVRVSTFELLGGTVADFCRPGRRVTSRFPASRQVLEGNVYINQV